MEESNCEKNLVKSCRDNLVSNVSNESESESDKSKLNEKKNAITKAFDSLARAASCKPVIRPFTV